MHGQEILQYTLVGGREGKRYIHTSRPNNRSVGREERENVPYNILL